MRTARVIVPLRAGVRPGSTRALHYATQRFTGLTTDRPLTPARFVGYAAPSDLPERYKTTPRVAVYEANYP